MSQDELVDIVNENGEILYVAKKSEAHEKGLLHKCVIAEVIDSKGRWFMARPSKNRQDAGQYVNPIGGHVTSGESDEDALKREANEEMGLTPNFRFECVGKNIFNRHVIGRQENHVFVMYKIFSDQELILSHESESGKYFTEEELKKELKENPKLFGDAFHFVAKSFFPNLLF